MTIDQIISFLKGLEALTRATGVVVINYFEAAALDPLPKKEEGDEYCYAAEIHPLGDGRMEVRSLNWCAPEHWDYIWRSCERLVVTSRGEVFDYVDDPTEY